MFTVEEEAKLEGSTVPQTIFGVCLSVCMPNYMASHPTREQFFVVTARGVSPPLNERH
jgi:hypothetical protein